MLEFRLQAEAFGEALALPLIVGGKHSKRARVCLSGLALILLVGENPTRVPRLKPGLRNVLPGCRPTMQ